MKWQGPTFPAVLEKGLSKFCHATCKWIENHFSFFPFCLQVCTIETKSHRIVLNGILITSGQKIINSHFCHTPSLDIFSVVNNTDQQFQWGQWDSFAILCQTVWHSGGGVYRPWFGRSSSAIRWRMIVLNCSLVLSMNFVGWLN